MLSPAAIEDAARLLSGAIIRTPLVYSPTFSEMSGAEVYLKLECMQKAGSFKVRGAMNRILSDRSSLGKNGVIAASAGNHAQGVAVAARSTGIPATIVMPEWVSPSKQEATAGYGATIVLVGKSLQESIDHALALAASREMTFIHPFDDELVIAGQGTIGLEILEDLPDAGMVVVPVGGGGLIAGIATAVKERRPEARIIGVQAESSPSAVEALRAGKPITIESEPSIADGIRVTCTGKLAFPVIRDLVEELVVVDDDEIIAAILALLERKKVLAEGGGAAPLAALMTGKLPVRENEKVVLVISGGNVDSFLLERILRKGLLLSGKILQVTVEMEEEGRSVAELLALVAREGATLIRLDQERAAPDLALSMILITLELEVRDRQHQEQLLRVLWGAGYRITPLIPHADISHGFYHSMESGDTE
ncbi:MAG: threonine ammonia-lyase [Methanoregulaceae archaeon]|jgi:threonine dehydratase|nr:threonine ammonia-lyase [Methanoregulaceae archaeon]